MDHLLTIPEELFLLTVNERTGRRAFIRSRKFDILLAAAILMDLALHNGIDCDMENIIPDSPEPTGHPLLDTVLSQVHAVTEPRKTAWWLVKLSGESAVYREMLISGLVEKGLVRMEKEHVFLGLSAGKKPGLVSDRELLDMRGRIRELVSGDGLPGLREMVIISLAWFGGLFDLILTDEEILARQGRIGQLARMDLIGQAVSGPVQEATRSILGQFRTGDLLGHRTPEEKLDDLAGELKALMHISRDGDLPEWLRKGTAQYQKTLDYIRETGTNEIVFDATTGRYGLKAGAGMRRTF